MIRGMRRLAIATLAIILTWTVGGLWLDSQVGHDGQLALGIFTACLLAALLLFHPPAVRLQALGVVLFATVGEVIGSLIWGLYTYRLENLPAFVPPGHGLIYLAGFSLATLCDRVLIDQLCADGRDVRGVRLPAPLDPAGTARAL